MPIIESAEKMPPIIIITWAIFVVEMIFRFFPSKFESPGCQKQFAKNYKNPSEPILLSKTITQPYWSC